MLAFSPEFWDDSRTICFRCFEVVVVFAVLVWICSRSVFCDSWYLVILGVRARGSADSMVRVSSETFDFMQCSYEIGAVQAARLRERVRAPCRVFTVFQLELRALQLRLQR
jgi:hypothetical protein